jgi:hypothetical protein
MPIFGQTLDHIKLSKWVIYINIFIYYKKKEY